MPRPRCRGVVPERIKPSATVILTRRAPEVEVYLVERSRRTRFFPGYHAFPGGVLDPADGEGREGYARAAVRELAEETGVRVGVEALVEAGTLLTPPFAPVRYHTTFYVCELPEGQAPTVDGEELVGGAWLGPAEAIRRFEEEGFPVPPPTLAYLRLLALHGDPLRAAEAAKATDGRPHHERFRIELHPGVYALPLRAPTLPPATTQNCYLVDGDPILVVDPGTPHEEERVALFHTLDGMTRDGRDGLIVLTHHHPDHVGSVAAVQHRYNFRVVATDATRRALPEGMVDTVVHDGHVFDLGTWAGRPWGVQALVTPGHTPGHLALRDTRWGALFAGDLVSGVSTILVHPGEGDMRHYMDSLRRCADLKPPIVLPGHGPAQPGDVFQRTLEHRRMREAKVLAALSDEPRQPADLVPLAYDDTPREAWGLAEGSLTSHLLKLEKEGKALVGRDGWRRAPGGAQ